jgi:Low-density lipoprotein receptor domain class A
MNDRYSTPSARSAVALRYARVHYVFPLFLASGCAFEPQLPDVSARESDAGTRDDTNSASAQQYDQVSDLFDTLTTTVREVRAFQCACEVGGTTQTVAQCVEATLSVTPPPIVQCSIDILASDERSLASLSCDAQAETDFLACLTKDTCSNFDNILACQIDRDVYERTNCPSLPWELWAKVQTECYGIQQPPPFTCKDGEVISSEWVCDFEEDCADGSDETACHP